MRHHHLLHALATAAVLSSACAPTVSMVREPTRYATRVISQHEMVTAAVANAWEAVQRLRPSWLRQRVTSGYGQGLRVYVHNSPRAMDDLRFISVQHIKLIRLVNARDATTRWGTNHKHGAIEIVEFP